MANLFSLEFTRKFVAIHPMPEEEKRTVDKTGEATYSDTESFFQHLSKMVTYIKCLRDKYRVFEIGR